MTYTHFVTMPGGVGVFHPVRPAGKGFREWTFLPPIISMWCRADGMPAVQVRANTQIIAQKIETASYCHMYDSALSGKHHWAANVVEADPCEYKPDDPKELVYDTVYHLPAMPTDQSVLYGPTGWGAGISIVAYGGNNDGAVCGRLCLDRIDNANSDIYWLTSPGTLRVDRHFSYMSWWRMDWTGGANWPTVDIYVSEFRKNAMVA